jgi:hypothetical protein
MDVALWSCSETGLCITAASAATLRPLLRKWKFLGIHHSNGGRSGGVGVYSSTLAAYSRKKGRAESIWPGNVGYVRGQRRSIVGGAEELVLEDRDYSGKILTTVDVTVEDYVYDRNSSGPRSVGSESSQTRITGTGRKEGTEKGKPLPRCPY